MANDYGNSSNYTVQLEGPFGSVGSSGKITQIELPATGWKNAESPFFQAVQISGISVSSMVQIQATKEQIEKLCSDGTALTIENDAGMATVYAIGNKPSENLILQIVLTEVVSA